MSRKAKGFEHSYLDEFIQITFEPVLVRIKPKTFTAPGVFVTTRLSLQETTNFEFNINQGTTSSRSLMNHRQSCLREKSQVANSNTLAIARVRSRNNIKVASSKDMPNKRIFQLFLYVK